MDRFELKAIIHKKIDSVEEPHKLNEINVFLSDILQDDSIDILDELNPAQLEKLKLAKQQAREGKTISHEEVKKLTREWFKLYAVEQIILEQPIKKTMAKYKGSISPQVADRL